MTQRLRSWLIGAALIVIGVLVGYALPQNSVSPDSVSGEVTAVHGTVHSAKASVDFTTKGAKAPVLYQLVNPTPWQASASGRWHSSGQPSCLVPGSTKPVRATLGVISVHGVGSAPGGQMVVWVECYG